MADHDSPADPRPALASNEPHAKRPHLPHAHNPNAEPTKVEHHASSVEPEPINEPKTEDHTTVHQTATPIVAEDMMPAVGQPVSFGSGPEGEQPSPPASDVSNTEELIPPKPFIDPKKMVTIGAGALVISLVVGGVWFQLNRHVYSLGNQPKTVAHDNASTTQPEALGANTGPKTLALSLNLKPLTQGHYQAWVVQDQTTTSLGGFNTEAAGPLKNLDGSAFAPTMNLTSTQSTKIIVTIEAGQEIATTPSKTVILSGDLKDGKAALTFTAMDLTQAGGVFTIATPTNGNDNDEKSGLWFAKTDGKTLTGTGLNLPEAPAGWKYEAQMFYKTAIVGMGRFSKPNQVDEFNKFTTNADKVPAFPGEDFLQKPPASLGIEFPTDITTGEWKAVISVEPDVNGTDPTGDGIFYIQPFTGSIPSGTEAHKEYQLTFDPTTLPSGSVELK